MLSRDLLAPVGVLETELVTAVVAHRHRRRPQAYDLDLVRMAAVARVRMVPAVHGHQGRPHDRVWAVRTHAYPIGTRSGRFSVSGKHGSQILLCD